MSAPRLLYYAPRSAPSRTVLMVARYLKVDLELKLVRLDQGEHKTPEFLKVIWWLYWTRLAYYFGYVQMDMYTYPFVQKQETKKNHTKYVYCLQVNFIYIHYGIPFF